MDTRHALRQLQFVIPGGAITFYLKTLAVLQRVWDSASGSWARCVSSLIPFIFPDDPLFCANRVGICRPLVLTSILSGLLTISLFLYILLIPVLKGIPPNVRPPSCFGSCPSFSRLLAWHCLIPLMWRLVVDVSLPVLFDCVLVVSIMARIWRALICNPRTLPLVLVSLYHPHSYF